MWQVSKNAQEVLDCEIQVMISGISFGHFLIPVTNMASANFYITVLHSSRLVSTAPVDPRQVIIELSGYVCRPEETTREAGGIAGVYQYDGLMKGPTGEDIGPSTGNELICIDAKKKGNDSRYTRRISREFQVVHNLASLINGIIWLISMEMAENKDKISNSDMTYH
ncbi:unnamed protein product [Caenorhabditis angaria]|uniref:Uncharacterized protein n=1 Tax=Caenorhabditis angaria TaxID=860376 RepID=A0A9P1IMX8_9PELO|nr:unnamed protein product [Caenorhabditis angaria]